MSAVFTGHLESRLGGLLSPRLVTLTRLPAMAAPPFQQEPSCLPRTKKKRCISLSLARTRGPLLERKPRFLDFRLPLFPAALCRARHWVSRFARCLIYCRLFSVVADRENRSRPSVCSLAEGGKEFTQSIFRSPLARYSFLQKLLQHIMRFSHHFWWRGNIGFQRSQKRLVDESAMNFLGFARFRHHRGRSKVN